MAKNEVKTSVSYAPLIAVGIIALILGGLIGAMALSTEADLGDYTDDQYVELKESLPVIAGDTLEYNNVTYYGIKYVDDNYVENDYALDKDAQRELDAYNALVTNAGTEDFMNEFIKDNEDFLVEYFDLEDEDDLNDYTFSIRFRSEKYADYTWDEDDNIVMNLPIVIEWETDDDFGAIDVDYELSGEYEDTKRLDDVEIKEIVLLE